jgi:general secretion pathway protein B
MSYILEALKKAQAERQLGNAPTIHAPQAAMPAVSGTVSSRKPLLVGLGAGALVVVAGALLLWRQQPAAPLPPSASAAGASAVPHGGAVPAVRAPDRPADALVVSAPPAAADAVPASVDAPAVPHARAPSTARDGGRAADAPVAASAAAPHPAASAPSAARAATAAAQAPAASSRAAAAPAPAPEDSLPYLQQLPDAQQRDIPRVTFGGYMYSANPADRLLLVDKALRHEGEEVAPGLVLEKLLPKAAVMNYRGTRYRVPY